MPKDSKKLEYLTGICTTYITHLNSVFNFFLVFSALVLNAIALTIDKDINGTSNIDEFVSVFGAIVGLAFLAMDSRTRKIIQHIECGIITEEKKVFPEQDVYLVGLPNPRFTILKHGYLFPIIYICFCVLFGALVFLV
jgi:hypothetical protein